MFFGISTVAHSNPVAFIGNMDLIEADTGGSDYSGTAQGTTFSGYFDDVDFIGEITNGSIRTEFGCSITQDCAEVINNLVLESDDISGFNMLAGSPIFSAGQIVDSVAIGSDIPVAGGGTLLIGLAYIFDPDTYDNDILNNFTFDPDAAIISTFFVVEEDAFENSVFSGGGLLLELPPQLTTVHTGPGTTDAILSNGASIDSGSSYTAAVASEDSLTINALIQPDSADVGMNLNIIVAVETISNGDIQLFTNIGLIPYIPTDPFLPLTTINNASVVNLVQIVRDFVITEAEIGNYNIYVGYQVQGGDGDIHYTLQPAPINVTGI